MKRSIIVAAIAATTLIVPAAASANPHTGTSDWLWNESAQATEQGNTVGELTSQITHNGWWVQDQIAAKGGRSAVVQSVLAQDGLGRSNR